ncbi:MFS-type transporter SLC18B1-like isoform X2 [Tachypleus tridentatus]|uniref:MFS-type transporter SLC18B1-like isoform X2 n=1 Tax=Tachypleus tridentatus TaxID=6853 RepID=UPI003FD41792
MPNMSKEDKNPLLEQNSSENKQYKSVEDQKEPLSDKKKLSENDNSLECKQNNKKQRFTSQQWATLFTLAFGNFCIGASISLQAPFFPQEAEKKGATATEYGLVFGIYQLTMFLTAPFCGKMIALVTPSFMLNAGIFVIGVASILFGFLDRAPNGNPFVYLALAVRVAEGFGSAAAKTSSYAIIALEFPNSVAKTFSLLETCIGIGLIAGPTIGGALYEVGGYEIPFITAGVLLLIDGILVYFILPDLDNSKIPKKSGNLFKFYKNVGIGLDFLVVFTTFNCVGFNQATLEPHLRQFNLTPFLLGSTFVISGAIYSITAPIWGWVCDHLPSTKPITLLGCTFMIICELLLGPTTFLPIDTQLWLVFVSLSVFGLAIGCKLVPTFIGALRNTIERGFPNDLTSYGLVSSMFTSAMALGYVVVA